MMLADFLALLVAITTGFGLGTYIGHEIGTRRGWADAREFYDRDDSDTAGA